MITQIKKYRLFALVVYGLLSIVYCLCLSGCASVPYMKPPAPPVNTPGIYHRVEKGQTLWRITQIYNVDLDEIANINRISDATDIEIGQLIFIPQRNKPREYLYNKSTSGEDFIWPLKGRVISGFGQPFNNMVNRGVNIQPQNASFLDVVASRSGKVVFSADNFEGFGKTIIIDHGDGFSTVYSGNAEFFIKAGDSVGKGTLIAKAGCTGSDKGVYLHFEIRKGYISQNPMFYLSR